MAVRVGGFGSLGNQNYVQNRVTKRNLFCFGFVSLFI